VPRRREELETLTEMLSRRDILRGECEEARDSGESSEHAEGATQQRQE